MSNSQPYPIGNAGQAWGDAERQQWLSQQRQQRTYQPIIDDIHSLASKWDIEQYGALSCDENAYPLFCLKSKNWQADRPVILITGGVHGYETSGVKGALAFAHLHADSYQQAFNILIAPCVSPWGFERIHRWTPAALDPNRSFYAQTPVEECALLMKLVDSIAQPFLAHFDLHETTDTDESEFRPALASRDGIAYQPGIVPDGFYLVDDSAKPTPDFQAAIIEGVRKVTYIAPADDQGQIIGSDVVQDGVIEYPVAELHLCSSLTDSPYCTTTEVYPDSPRATDAICNQAQVAAIEAGLNYLLKQA